MCLISKTLKTITLLVKKLRRIYVRSVRFVCDIFYLSIIYKHWYVKKKRHAHKKDISNLCM